MANASNTLEGRAEPYLKRIEALHADMDSAKGTYMSECKERREDIKNVYTEAKDNGVPAKALKGLVRYRFLEKKQAAISDGIDIDEQSSYAQLVEALGPLGQAAAERAGFAKATE